MINLPRKPEHVSNPIGQSDVAERIKKQAAEDQLTYLRRENERLKQEVGQKNEFFAAVDVKLLKPLIDFISTVEEEPPLEVQNLIADWAERIISREIKRKD